MNGIPHADISEEESSKICGIDLTHYKEKKLSSTEVGHTRASSGITGGKRVGGYRWKN